MKQYMKKIIVYIMTVAFLFVSCPFCVYASEHGGGGGTDHNSDFITDSGTINVKDDGVVMYYIEYILAQIGAIISDHDITKAMANDLTMKEYISKGKFDPNKNTVVFPKETIIYVKEQLDNYTKQNEPYYMVNTLTLDDFTGNSHSGSKIMYDTVKNLLNESPSGVIAFGAYYSRPTYMYFADLGSDFKNISPVSAGSTYVRGLVNIYDNESWNQKTYKVYKVELESTDSAIENKSEFIEKAKYTYDYGLNNNYSINRLFRTFSIGEYVDTYPYNCSGINSYLSLVANDKRRIRVFNTYGDFQNYTLGKRSVYYTSKYYNYVPEDLTVSLDELQKEIDDLSDVIDKLLEQITKDTDESEIEELLQQILEELRKNPGGGGGSSGGGNVTVNVDMSTTNSWLSKIYDKVSQISDKISSFAGQSMSEVVESIENLEKMLKKYLSEITGDLDDIKGQLEEMTEQEFSDKTDSFLEESTESFSEIGELAKTKFPLSIPYDLYNLLAVISPKQSEQAEVSLYSVDDMAYNEITPVIYEGNGNTISVMSGSGSGTVGMSSTGAPVFNLPIVVNSVGWDYTVVVDMSQFQTIADLSRTMFTLIFILGIINLSIKVIGLWGDIVD